MKSHKPPPPKKPKRGDRRSWLHCFILIGIFHKSDLACCLIAAGGNPTQTQLFVRGVETSLRVSLLELSPGARSPLCPWLSEGHGNRRAKPPQAPSALQAERRCSPAGKGLVLSSSEGMLGEMGEESPPHTHPPRGKSSYGGGGGERGC